MNLRSLLATTLLMCLLLAPSALAATDSAAVRPATGLIVAVGIAGAGLLTSAGPRRPV
jgi:hypothetical protein